jgi:HAD superfamily hydrolase (TIGR01509 family)
MVEPLGAARVLGLPEDVTACLFDLDGVLTDTAALHAAAWRDMFDGFLRQRAARDRAAFVAFDPVGDYDTYVDGKPREDGVRCFLRSRGIDLARGNRDDAPAAETIRGLGERKNELVLGMMHHDGVRAYEGSVRYVQAVREAGLRRAVVSSSMNCREVLAAAGIEELFEERIDGVVAEREHLAGNPAGRALGVSPARCAVFEDALAGVEAGRGGGFAYVVGVDRAGQAEALRAHGADVVVADLSELLHERAS